jgi:hypothetical protein
MGRIAAGRDLAEQAQGPDLITTAPVLHREIEGARS